MVPIWKQVVNAFGFAIYVVPNVVVIVIEDDDD